MPGQDARKTSKRGAKAERKPSRSAAVAKLAPARAAPGRIGELEAEIERLRTELAAARQRVSELEATRDEVLDRIAWVIDSLHNLIED